MTPCHRLWSNYCASTLEKLLEMPIKLEHPASGSALWLASNQSATLRTTPDLSYIWRPWL